MMSQDNPLLKFTRGNQHRARHLQWCFEIIRDHAADSAVRRTAQDVLSGKLSPRDAVQQKSFAEALLPGIRQGFENLPLHDEEKLQALAAEGERRYLDITAAPINDRVEPQRSDDDDDYFDRPIMR